jgi:F420-dependent oxidoreductase-like protein
MKVGALIEPRLPGAPEFAAAAERIGVTSLWVPEVWGYDALTGLAYLAAKTSSIQLGTFVVQLGSRSPAMLATSALSLQALSGGRFLLGIGTSGPRVMEGWHGVRFRKPVQTTRETIEIVRIVSRGERLEHAGEVYPLPLPDSRGAALRPMVRPDHVPVYVAAMGPQNLRLTGELADGWLGTSFVPERADAYLSHLDAGLARAGRTRASLDICQGAEIALVDEADLAATVASRKSELAFSLGGMGTATANFYNDAYSRQGWADVAARVRERW